MSRFERRLYTGFALLVALFTPILIGAFVVISQIETTQGDLISKNAEDVILAERLNTLVNREFVAVQSFILRHQTGLIESLNSIHDDFQATSERLLTGREKEESPEILVEIQRLENDAFTLAQEAVRMKEAGRSIEDINEYFEKQNFARGARMLQLVRENARTQMTQLTEARVQADRFSRRLVWGFIAATAFSFLATLAICTLMFIAIRSKAREDARKDELHKQDELISQARKQAVEVVSHDLKNPLSSLKMSVEMVRDELEESNLIKGDIKLGFDIAARSMRSMQALIDDQLDHAKIEAGQLIIDRVSTDLTELIEDLGLRYRSLAKERSLDFQLSCAPCLRAAVDASRFEQVISNLVGNALKFTPAGGRVQLIAAVLPAAPSTDAHPSRISIRVSDNGQGISPSAKQHVFERYWQAKETAKKGTGLGLAIAKSIVEAHDGTLTCESEVGEGSTFEIIIPSETAVSTSTAAQKPAPKVAAAEPSWSLGSDATH